MSRRPARLNAERLEDRLTPATAGTLDPTFGNGGVASIPSGAVNRLAAVPDGHILALVRSPSSFSLERLNPDGTPDPTFGTGGVAAIPPYFDAFSVLTALPDGGALVGTVANGSTNPTAFDLTRVTAAGVVDPTFGTNGIAVVPIPAGAAGADLGAAAVQPDGRIVLVGDYTLNPLTAGGANRYYSLVAARLTAAGQPDPSFGTGGSTIISTDPTRTVISVSGSGVALQPDGRIVLAGGAATTPTRVLTFAPVAIRLTTNGQLDPTFGAGGWTTVQFPQGSSGFFGTVSVLADGQVMLAGSLDQTSGAVGGAARLTADGRLDPSYGTGGVAVTSPYSSSPSFHTAIDPTGRAVFDVSAGAAYVFRLTTSGAADGGFGTNGQVSVGSLPGLGQYPASDLNLEYGLALQPNGDILLSGTNQATQPVPTSGLIVKLIGSNPPAGFVPATTGTVAAGGADDGTFQVLNPTSGTFTNAGTVTAFPGFGGNVRVATADVNGDGTPDYIVGAGPGGAPEVTVYDGKTGVLIADFPAFESTFTGGVFVAAADLTGDGRADVVVTPDQGGGPRVVIFSVAPGGGTTQVASFFGINDPSFRGGARVAAGDLNGDGTPDLAVAAGFLGGPRVALWNGKTLFSGAPAELVNDFFAFPGADATTLRNGVYVAIGGLTGTGNDLIFGGGPGGAPRVLALSAAQVVAGNVAAAQASPVANFFVAGNSADRGGARVAVTRTSGAGADDLVVGSGAGDPARVRVYTGGFGAPGEPSAFQDVGVFGGAALPDGVYVG